MLGRVKAVSAFHDTEPVGYVDQPRFLNGALLLETELGAEELMLRLREIELEMGRNRAEVAAKGPRVIDLDLLLFGDAVIATSDLRVPHPGLNERRFVLEPLAEIGGEMVDPVSRLTIKALLAQL